MTGDAATATGLSVGGMSARRRREVLEGTGWTAAVLGVSVATGYLVAARAAAVLHDRMLPWILSRTLGIAAYVALSALVAVGIWYRHPWRTRRRTPGPQALLRAHVSLAAATVVLLCGHVVAIAVDRFAGVGWVGVAVPWHAQYRPTAVALGTLALYGIVLVATTAALAGSVARRVWLPIHSISAVLFALCLAHGLLAGSDSRVLWSLYALSGAVVGCLQVTRMAARHAELTRAW